MGYCIQYAMAGGVLRAVVSGRSAFASAIAEDIGELARDSAARRLLIDVRKLRDRVGRLRSLLNARHAPERIAVLDQREHDNYYVFAELAAKSRGVLLKRFEDEQEALYWLQFGSEKI